MYHYATFAIFLFLIVLENEIYNSAIFLLGPLPLGLLGPTWTFNQSLLWLILEVTQKKGNDWETESAHNPL